MLTHLHIKNIVLIDQLSLDFSNGLTGFTGETGAGKSILLDSLGLALGARADMNLLRKGEESASVTAVFEVLPMHSVKEIFAEHDLNFETEIRLKRTLGRDGKSKCFVNDEIVGVSVLRSLGDRLADIHGQFETYGLLNPSSHIKFLDEFAGVSDDVNTMRDQYSNMIDAKEQWQRAMDDARKAKEDEDFLRHAVEELEKLSPVNGEETELTSIKQNLGQREFIINSLNDIDQIISHDKGAEAQLIKAARSLQKLLDKQRLLGGDEAMQNLDAALSNIQNFVSYIDSVRSNFEHPEHNLESIDDRLYALRSAARKFQCAVEELPETLNKFKQSLLSLKHADDLITKYEAAYIESKRKAETTARVLSSKRQAEAETLDALVAKELPPLKLAKAKFKTKILTKELSSNGIDDVSFTVATNAESDFGALNKVASGGEMARFMLAIKVVLAGSSAPNHCYVFDEIDTGIGGATAAAVGERLARMADTHQVLVVTHSPQVAAAAQTHFNVRKDGMKTDVVCLNETARQEEIARMLSGASVTNEARAAALKLLIRDKSAA
jgi:DNA repair protein RecN (Recombination protein N)